MADLAQKPPRVCAPDLQVRALPCGRTIVRGTFVKRPNPISKGRKSDNEKTIPVLYVDRTSYRDRDHRDPVRAVTPRAEIRAGDGQQGRVPQQPEIHRHAHPAICDERPAVPQQDRRGTGQTGMA